LVIPGGAVLPIYDELKNHTSIKHILVRHEQGAGHAAEGYARSSGKPGVVLVTSGPGATNVVTALTDAYMDSGSISLYFRTSSNSFNRNGCVSGM
jgi:acetolactate synthase-1/2/3 large subunit